jgi:hypothetical protein
MLLKQELHLLRTGCICGYVNEIASGDDLTMMLYINRVQEILRVC